jgi:hypothetical protein
VREPVEIVIVSAVRVRVWDRRTGSLVFERDVGVVFSFGSGRGVSCGGGSGAAGVVR